MNILKNKWLSLLLVPFALLYVAIVTLRNKFYDWHIFRSHKIPNCTVISIGNITIGGTGKTPAVEFLAKYLTAKGKKVAVLSRGYQRESKGTLLVTNGQTIFANPRNSGDEPYLLARHLSNVPIVTEGDRYKGGMFLKKKFNPDYLILDDAFQHRKIYRDLDIVLIDSLNGLKNQFPLPRGVLREPLKGLTRADVIWLTRVDQTNEISSVVCSITKRTAVPIIKTIHQPQSLYSLSTEKQFRLESLKSRKVFIFSGIGNPDAFHNTIAKLQADIKGNLLFKDHHKYNRSDLRKIDSKAQQSNAEWTITTEKDALRIYELPVLKIPIFYLKIELKICDGIEQLEKILNM